MTSWDDHSPQIQEYGTERIIMNYHLISTNGITEKKFYSRMKR